MRLERREDISNSPGYFVLYLRTIYHGGKQKDNGYFLSGETACNPFNGPLKNGAVSGAWTRRKELLFLKKL